MTLDIKKIEELLSQWRDPLAQWMADEGYDPADGGLLILPSKSEVDWGVTGPPYYVRHSDFLEKPLLLRTPPIVTRGII